MVQLYSVFDLLFLCYSASQSNTEVYAGPNTVGKKTSRVKTDNQCYQECIRDFNPDASIPNLYDQDMPGPNLLFSNLYNFPMANFLLMLLLFIDGCTVHIQLIYTWSSAFCFLHFMAGILVLLQAIRLLFSFHKCHRPTGAIIRTMRQSPFLCLMCVIVSPTVFINFTFALFFILALMGVTRFFFSPSMDHNFRIHLSISAVFKIFKSTTGHIVLSIYQMDLRMVSRVIYRF